MTKFIPSCPACQEMEKSGLTYEETHSSHIPGMLMVEDEWGAGYIESPHFKDVIAFITDGPNKGEAVIIPQYHPQIKYQNVWHKGEIKGITNEWLKIYL